MEIRAASFQSRPGEEKGYLLDIHLDKEDQVRLTKPLVQGTLLFAFLGNRGLTFLDTRRDVLESRCQRICKALGVNNLPVLSWDRSTNFIHIGG